MKIVSYTELNPSDWDRVCDLSSQAWLYHRSGWIDIETVHNGCINYSFAVSDGVQILAIQPLYKTVLGLGTWSEILLHSGIHRHTGLAVIDGVDELLQKSIASLVLKQIHQIATSIDADRIQLNVQTLSPSTFSSDLKSVPFWMKSRTYYYGLGFGPSGIAPAPGISTACYDQVVMLTRSEDKLFSSMDDSSRKAVRKAQSAGLQIVQTSESAVADYYSIALKSASRTGEVLSSESYYQDIWNKFSKSGKCFIFIASYQERNVAALFLLIDKNGVSYMGGVSNPEYLHLRVNNYIHWAAIKWAKSERYLFYRLGPYFPELPDDWHISRVARFKTMFGAESIPIIQGSHFRKPNKYIEIGRNQVSLLAGYNNT